MSTNHELATRFSLGSNPFYAQPTGSREYSFFVQMPADVSRLAELGKQTVDFHRRTLSAITANHAEHQHAMQEVAIALDGIHTEMSAGFCNVSDAIDQLESHVCHYLAEIRWILGQLDENVAELVRLVRFPRQTEAAELVEDGVQALATGNLDDAEACLQNAVNVKRTSFQAHTNLGFVYLHKNEGPLAIVHFKKAADYAPHYDKDSAKVFALENLARAYYAIRDFEQARITSELALGLRNDKTCEAFRQSALNHAVYCALSGREQKAISIIVDLARQDTKYLALAAVNPDIENIRQLLFRAFEEVISKEHHAALVLAVRRRDELRQFRSAHPRNARPITEIVSRVEAILSVCDVYIASHIYQNVVCAGNALAALTAPFACLPELAVRAARLDSEKKTLEKDREAYFSAWKSASAFEIEDANAARRHNSLMESLRNVQNGCGLSVILALVAGAGFNMAMGYTPRRGGDIGGTITLIAMPSLFLAFQLLGRYWKHEENATSAHARQSAGRLYARYIESETGVASIESSIRDVMDQLNGVAKSLEERMCLAAPPPLI